MQLYQIIIFIACAASCIAMIFASIVLFTKVDLGQELLDQANELTENYYND
jgi:hypothetical protein